MSALIFVVAIANSIGGFSQETMRGAILRELSQLNYPPLARHANIYGDVSIGVTVHPDGKTEVAFESGHPMLRQAAMESAQKSRFECRECDSTVTYQLVYSFRLTKGSDCCTATSRPASVSLDPPSGDPNMQRQAHITVTADEICICDPSFESMKKRGRSAKCLYLWNCS
jgi:TonB family protein